MKGIIFPNLAYNTNRNFVRGVAKGGCEIWLPVENSDKLQEAKIEFQKFLDDQSIDEEPKELA